MSGLDRYLAAVSRPARKPRANAAPRRKPEADLQKAVVKALRLTFRDIYVHGSLMGVNLGPRKGAEAKAMGCNAGWPDLCILIPTRYGVLHTYFIELKSPDKNVTESALSVEQKAFREMCRAGQVPYAVCNSVEVALQTVSGWVR